jgi:hypothetical protein
MKVRAFALIVTLWLCTCVPAPATDSSYEAFRDREEVLAGAYQTLDAAVMDRMLADDFTVIYAGSGGRKQRAAYLSDLAALRDQFPQLTVELDSLRVSHEDTVVRTTGKRIYGWRMAGTPGQYSERFRNVWEYRGGKWTLAQTTLESTLAH